MTRYRSLWYMMLQAILFIPAIANAKTPDDTRITVVIEPVFNGRPFILANQYYIDGYGDTLYIDEFKFYISNLKLSARGGGISYPDAHLIDAEDPGTLTFHIDNAPYGTFSEMQFVVGVDSLSNVNGANAGDLDPAKGMYWAWNSGYIMAKMTGRAKVCHTLHHGFEFHIGGYMPPYNAARTVNVKLPYPIDVKMGKNTIIKINADAAEWFRDKLNLSKVNSILIPGKEACMMADNYAHMFSVAAIKSDQGDK